MTKNESNLDRVVRGILGLFLVLMPLFSGAALFANPVVYWLSLIVGVVLLITAATGFCALYALLGVRTNN